MPLASEIVRLLQHRAAVQVAEVRIGLSYMAVSLADGRLGVAFTFMPATRRGCALLGGLHPLAGRPAGDLLQLLESAEPIESGVGLACANALITPPVEAQLSGDILDTLRCGPEDDVAMVGLFGPLVAPLQRRCRTLTVFEREPVAAAGCGMKDGGALDLRPVARAAEQLRDFQVALITATALMNRSLDGLLEAAAGCREVVVLGASTPLLAEAFRDTSATLLSGVMAQDPTSVLRVVGEGGGMRLFRPYVRKVSLRVLHTPNQPTTR